MLIRRIGKAFEPSLHRPARDLGKRRRQDREEHYGDGRGEHRQSIGGGFWSPTLVVAIGGYLRRKLATKAATKGTYQRHLPKALTKGTTTPAPLEVPTTRQQDGLKLDPGWTEAYCYAPRTLTNED